MVNEYKYNKNPMRKTVLIFTFLMAAVTLGSQEFRDEVILMNASGSGTFIVRWQSEGRTYQTVARDHWQRTIKSRTGNLVILGARANNNPVDISINEHGLSILKNRYAEIQHITN